MLTRFLLTLLSLYLPHTAGRGGLIPYGGKEHYVPKVEILCGDENSVRWQDDDGVLNVEGKNLVQGGTWWRVGIWHGENGRYYLSSVSPHSS